MSLGIVGAGSRGQGLTRLLVEAGHTVVLKELSPEQLAASMREIEQGLDREISRWALTESEKKIYLGRIEPDCDYTALAGVEAVFECTQDEISHKRMVYRELDAILPPATSIYANTATISVTELAKETKRADRICGVHLPFPRPRRRVAELVRGLRTSDETVAEARRLLGTARIKAIEVVEYPGYVTTRVILPFLNEAMTVVMEGIASAEDVDESMRLAFDMALGPLELADRLGLDVVLLGLDHLFHELGELKFRPSPLLRKLVRAGHLGVQSGRGFFHYDGEGGRLNANETARGSGY